MSAPPAWRDVAVLLEDRPGALADFGQVLGAAGVGLEGGGVFTHAGLAIAHFLVDDAERAREALTAANIGPVTVNRVLTVRLRQDVPGQLGAFTRRLGEAGISILVQYSDHDHRLVLVVEPDQHRRAGEIARAWDQDQDRTSGGPG
ncbi:hypothetical protein KIH74_29965 [Kineosporia sp. J2-2]|uniref:ACT domain-containing protein n=1 Tax=Kineosporia corallincola TaxID=2835133 RepID=A0ABS5TQ16_9ACTN|nr:hypothetical protein [Kineosporia corallincola]MBT0773208.1 hypothetical protein [Kineosporia corallincola]